MRAFRLVLVVAASLIATQGARAAIVPFEATLTIIIGPSAGNVALPVAGLATINGSAAGPIVALTQVSLPAAAHSFGGVTVPLPNAFPLVANRLSVVSMPAAVYSSGQTACGTPHPLVTCSGGAALHGRSGLQGNMFIGTFGTASFPFANLTIPIGVVGSGSTAMVPGAVISTLTLSGAGWTSGTGVAHTSPTFVASAMGGQTVDTIAGTAMLLLVSPMAFAGAGGFPVAPAFAELRLTFDLPEPGITLLLGSAVTYLAVMGWRRRSDR